MSVQQLYADHPKKWTHLKCHSLTTDNLQVNNIEGTDSALLRMPRYASTPASVPDEGHVAFYSNKMYYSNNTTWKQLADDDDAGDVNGPASSTDNAVVRYDGATGKLLKDSNVLVDNLDNLSLPAGKYVEADTVQANAGNDLNLSSNTNLKLNIGGIPNVTLDGSKVSVDLPLDVNDATGSSSPSTGSGVFAGGVGIGENCNVSGNVDVNGGTVQNSSGNLTVRGQDSATGGNATLRGGDASPSGAGGSLTLLSGGGGTGGTSGASSLKSADTNTGNSGSLSLASGTSNGGNSGAVTLNSGNTVGAGVSGNVSINGGSSASSGGTVSILAGGRLSTGNGSNVTVTGGQSGSTSGLGGNVTVSGGLGQSDTGGNVTVQSGSGGGTGGASGTVIVTTPNATGLASAGNVNIRSGNGSGSGSSNGGDINVEPGSSSGASIGRIMLGTDTTPGHVYTRGPVPTVGSGTIVASSTDSAGEAQIIAGPASTQTVTFNKPYAGAANVIVNITPKSATSLYVSATSTTSFTVTNPSGAAVDYYYQVIACI